MRNIINNQKKERDMLLAMPYITRQTKYDEQSLLSSKQIKLITGPRRSGKSTEALMLQKQEVKCLYHINQCRGYTVVSPDILAND